MTRELPALKLVPSLEDRIRHLRRCDMECPMVDMLDQRIARQRELVQKLLTKHSLTIDTLQAMSPEDVVRQDEELQLWYHILRDCDYIDSLR